MTAGFSLRPATPDDEPFLLGVYASTREEELALTGWDDAQKAAFVRMQFDAQDRHYREHYADASFDIVLVDGVAAGRLCVARWPAEIRIVDVALLPMFRNGGAGTILLRDLLAEGAATGSRVTIHVERFNRALRLYERLGFLPVGERGIHLLLEWRPPASAQANTAS